MKKLVATTLAVLMMLVVGCRIEVDTTTRYNPMVMESGKLMVSGGFSEEMLSDFLRATDEVKDYHILINSKGGAAFAALGMINRIEDLQSKGAHITTESYGYSFSAGTYLFLAGDTRIAHTGSAFMFHAAGVNTYGGRSTLKSEGLDPSTYDMLNICDDVFIQMMMERTTMSLDDANYWLYFEDFNFMTSEMAFELNVATEIKGT
jgi:ATP-dependent protease ClpP protease subunit